jgi:hypothetical protein
VIGRLLRAHVAPDEDPDQEDHHRDDHRRHEQKNELLAAEVNLVEAVVHDVVGDVRHARFSVSAGAFDS